MPVTTAEEEPQPPAPKEISNVELARAFDKGARAAFRYASRALAGTLNLGEELRNPYRVYGADNG